MVDIVQRLYLSMARFGNWRQGSSLSWRRWAWWRGQQRASIDYRERISVVTWITVFGIGLSLLLDVPTMLINLSALGSPISFPISSNLIMAAAVAVVAAAGTESIIRAHPRIHVWTGTLTWAFWALPMAISIISVLLLPQATTQLLQVILLLVTGVLLATVFFSLYATVEIGQPGYRRARFVLDALAYGSALLLFLFVYQTRTRSLLSATLVALTAGLLAVEILRTSTNQSRPVLIYGGVVAVLLGEATWALNYWPLLPGLTGGMLLLLSFYLAVGIAQQALQQRLTLRIFLEFAVFGAFALLLIVLFGPGF